MYFDRSCLVSNVPTACRDQVIAAALDKMISKERARQAKARKAKKKPPQNGSST